MRSFHRPKPPVDRPRQHRARPNPVENGASHAVVGPASERYPELGGEGPSGREQPFAAKRDELVDLHVLAELPPYLTRDRIDERKLLADAGQHLGRIGAKLLRFRVFCRGRRGLRERCHS